MASRLVAKIPTWLIVSCLASVSLGGCAVIQELRGDAPWQKETSTETTKPSGVENQAAPSETPAAQPTPAPAKDAK